MVHLVKNDPESIGVTDAVPPVKKESTDQPSRETLQHRAVPGCEMKYGCSAQPIKPEFIGPEGDRDLTGVDEQYPCIPSFCIGQFATGENAFPYEKDDRNDNCTNGRDPEVHWR